MVTELVPHTDTAAWRKFGSDLERTAGRQLGSLGSGNHFVEICLDESDAVWIVLHSGSRGVGNKLASVHIDVAKGLMAEWFIDLEDKDLAYLVQGTAQFDDYIADMLWAQDYAMTNRELMLAQVLSCFAAFMDADLTKQRQINCHHNFTQMEHHHDRDMWITRKGAIKAGVGDSGVIPGSMGTRSYIVSGLGSTESYNSCSHGAGRQMSRRRRARHSTVLDSSHPWRARHGTTTPKRLIDEDPRGYKDIDVVMENQKDLVTIDHTLRQILNYKGV